MSRVTQKYQSDGFFGIGIVNNIDGLNIGTLWRSAYIMGASFIFTLDKKYKIESSDITRAWTKIPLYHYRDIEELKENLPYATKLVGVELDERAVELSEYQHPTRAAYLLGNESTGLTKEVMAQCHDLIQLPGSFSLNVAVAGSIVLYDRVSKVPTVLPQRG